MSQATVKSRQAGKMAEYAQRAQSTMPIHIFSQPAATFPSPGPNNLPAGADFEPFGIVSDNANFASIRADLVVHGTPPALLRGIPLVTPNPTSAAWRFRFARADVPLNTQLTLVVFATDRNGQEQSLVIDFTLTSGAGGAPTVHDAEWVGAIQSVAVQYSEPMDLVTLSLPGNYSLTDLAAADADIVVNGASSSGSSACTVHLSRAPSADFTLIINPPGVPNPVRNSAGVALATNTAVPITVDF